MSEQNMASLLPNPFDERDVWLDELVGGGGESLPKRYRVEGLSFEPQGAWPFCAAMCVTKMVECAVARLTGVHVDLSQTHLFFNAGGTMGGSTFRGNLDFAKRFGCLSYAKMPMPEDLYDLAGFDVVREKALKTAAEPAKEILGYARVTPDRDALKRAILANGPVLVGVAASGGYWAERAKRPPNKPDNHAVLLVGWDEDGSWWLFDSLQPSKDFSGYHMLDRDYAFNSAYVVTELPDGWKEIRDNARVAPSSNANYYGKPRDLELEKHVASDMLAAFDKFDNQSVKEAAGRFWETYIRAVAYGGYNVSYVKYGRWMSGDIVNDCYAWRRTGKHVFDFDLPRS